MVAHGGTHFALTAACGQMLEEHVSGEIEHYFGRVFCPEEKFYHSLLASQSQPTSWSLEPYRGRGQWRYANLHHIDESLVKVYTEDDWQEVRSSDKFFLRKLEFERSRALLDRIDTDLLGI